MSGNEAVRRSGLPSPLPRGNRGRDDDTHHLQNMTLLSSLLSYTRSMDLSSSTYVPVACSGTLVGPCGSYCQRDINIMLSGPIYHTCRSWLLSMLSFFLNMLSCAYRLVVVVWLSFILFCFSSLDSFLFLASCLFYSFVSLPSCDPILQNTFIVILFFILPRICSACFVYNIYLVVF